MSIVHETWLQYSKRNAQINNAFYQKVLGLRRVKKTVNQDNLFMYHSFYVDLTGSAGTELSFFEMPNVGRTIRGTNTITQIGSLVLSVESLTFWKKRFESLQVKYGEITTYAGRDALHFEDPVGRNTGNVIHSRCFYYFN